MGRYKRIDIRTDYKTKLDESSWVGFKNSVESWMNENGLKEDEVYIEADIEHDYYGDSNWPRMYAYATKFRPETDEEYNERVAQIKEEKKKEKEKKREKDLKELARLQMKYGKESIL